MLTYNQFKSELLDELRGLLAPSKELRVSKVLKNNDVYLDSVSFLDSETIGRVTPVVYLQNYFSQYENGVSMEKIAKNIFTVLTTQAGVPMIDLQCIESFDKAKERIVVSVVNMELNHERLSTMPHRPWEDLAIVYKYNIEPFNGSDGTITITNQLMEKWGITEEDLYQVAMDNISKMKWTFTSIHTMMKNLLAERNEDTDMELPEFDPAMYVVTTSEMGTQGASAILFPELFEDFIQENDIECMGLYILPSSIFELIVIPCKNGELTVSYLKDMVSEVNHSSVEEQDVLSYSVYFYDPKNRCIGITE